MPSQKIERRPTRRRLLVPALLFASSTVFALILGEVGLRVFHRLSARSQVAPNPNNSSQITEAYETPGLSYGSQDNFCRMEFDPVLIHRPIRPQEGRGFRINAQGFRHAENVPPQKPPRQFRVLILGGSFAFGAGTPDGYTYFNVAERSLEERFADSDLDFVVASGGVGAYTHLQEYLLYMTRLRDFDADLFVFLTLWNDAWKAYDGFRPMDGNDRMNYGAAIEGSIAGKLVGNLGWRAGFADASRPPTYSSYRSKIHWLVDRALHNISSVPAKRHAVDPDQAVRELEVIVRQVAAVAKAQKHRLVYILQPDIYSTRKNLSPTETRLLDEYRERYPEVPPYFARFRSAYLEHMPAVFEELEVDWFDTDGELAGDSTGATYFVDHVHFGERGQAWMGRYLAELIAPRVQAYLNSPR
ncbi:MAG: hypothetical protein O6942_02395 [Bacteroidetes bacterium]|nr:hypothetical protein [Bacteroidota bacterium]